MRELLPTIAMNENVNKKDDYDEYMEYVLTSNK
jgi:hypothetical protein